MCSLFFCRTVPSSTHSPSCRKETKHQTAANQGGKQPNAMTRLTYREVLVEGLGRTERKASAFDQEPEPKADLKDEHGNHCNVKKVSRGR